MARLLGFRRAEWVPLEAPRPLLRRPREIDWPLLASLAPGQARHLGPAQRARSPRCAAGAGVEILARTAAGVEPAGVLRLFGGAPPGRAAHVAPDRLVALAGLAARAGAAREALARAGDARGGAATGRLAALTHDLRNQLALALMQLQRAREGDGLAGVLDGLDRLESSLCAARDLCVEGLEPPGSGAARSLVLRAILLDEARAAAAVARPALHGSPRPQAVSEADGEESRRVSVRLRCPTDLRVHGALGALSRVVRNLLLNAVEASHEGGVVSAEASAAGDGRVVLEVRDEGRGMARADVRRLFEAAEARAGGTGHGTTSLLHCLEDLGAELRVETAPGAGTRMRVWLPAVPDAERALIVVADRDRVRRRARCAALRSAGLATWEAASPREALTLLRRTRAAGILVARGLAGPRLEALEAQAARDALPLWVVGAAQGAPQETAALVLAALGDPPRGSHRGGAGTRTRAPG